MSLIERAVQKIGPHPEKDSPAVPVDVLMPPAPKASLVEVAMQGAASARSATTATEAPSARVDALSPPPGMPAAPVLRDIAQIDLGGLIKRGFITPQGPPTQLSQQFRVIKRPLLANAFGRGNAPVHNGNRVMVTSSFPGEGKTFCAINLAISIAAERDYQVLLVDADVARPSVMRELGLDDGPGLMDWLIDGRPDIGELVQPTNIDKLAILPAGRRNEHATEFIASQAMARLVDELSTRFADRILVFDSPPLLVTTEAQVLASHMGQIVMVVEASSTPRDSVKAAIDSIEGCEVVGLLLNKAKETTNTDGYYGYGGYGYGHDARNGRRS
jgi:protein-tyrosine kinase